MNRSYFLFLRLFLLTFLCVSISADVKAASKPAVLYDVCVNEGSYLGHLSGHSDPVRINIVCNDDQSEIVVTITNPPPTDVVINETMSFSLIDGPNLVAANFPIDATNRPNVSANMSLTYVKISLASLATRHLTGVFMNNALSIPVALNAELAQDFHSSGGLPCQSRPEQDLPGLYLVKGTSFKLYADIIDGAPLFNLTVSSIFAAHLVNSSKWNGSGEFYAATPFGNGEPQTSGFYQLRGCFSASGQLNLVTIDSRNGLRGPFVAVKEAL